MSMKKKTGPYLTLFFASTLVVAGLILSSKAESFTSFRNASADTFSISASAVNNFVSGDEFDTFDVYTEFGNVIHFESKGVTVVEGGLSFVAGGYIRNPYTSDEYHNKISGMSEIKIDHSGNQGDLLVDYTWGESLTTQAPYYQRRGFVFPTTTTYSFLSESPNYVCIRASSAVVVNGIMINYSCTEGSEKGDNLKIYDAAMLERFKTTVNWGTTYIGQTVELVSDIYNWSSVKDYSTKGFTPIGTSTYPFKGTFEGNGHIISGLKIVDATGNSAKGFKALFGYAVDANFRNLTLANIDINANKEYCAGLVAALNGGDIENVTIESGTINALKTAGGIVGNIGKGGDCQETYISNCVNKASITDNDSSAQYFFGGIFGGVQDSNTQKITVIGCKNYGAITGNHATDNNTGCVAGIGGIIRKSSGTGSTEVSHCVNYGNILSNVGSTAGIIGRARAGIIKDNYVKDDTSITVNGVTTASNSWIGTGGSTPARTGRIVGIVENSPTISIYDNCDEDGVSVNAIEISSADDLLAARTDINSNGSTDKYYKLASDIDLTGVSFGDGIGNGTPFVGVFDGCGHTITGLTTSSTTQAGFFYSGNGGVIKNLNMSDVSITATKNRAGGIIGRAKGVLIYNCHILSGSIVTATDSTASEGVSGGIAGVTLDGTTIRNCSNNATVLSSHVLVGGIVGQAYSNKVFIEHCENNGSVSSSYPYNVNGAKVGGILGGTYASASSLILTINGCINTGDVSSNNRATGGIAGQIGCSSSDRTHIISNCVNHGSVSSTEIGSKSIGTGGIVGALGKLESGVTLPSNVKALNCINTGSIQSGGGSIGGIAGCAFADAASSTAVIDSCRNYGSVTNTNGGDNDSAVGTGGILGASQPNNSSASILSVTNCINVGNVLGTRYVGGIVGLPRKTSDGSTIDNCVNFGNVSGTSTLVAGVAGCIRINISNNSCYTNALLTNKTQINVVASTTEAVSGGGATVSYITTEEQNETAATNNHLVSFNPNCKSFNVPKEETAPSSENIGEFNSFTANNKVGPEYSWPSIVKMNNNKYLLTATSGYAVSGSISSESFGSWKTRSNSYGQDYVRNPLTHEDTSDEAVSANFQPLVLPDGRVVILYRTNPKTISGQYRYSSLRAIVSDDYCSTWTKYVIFENYANPNNSHGGAYEPFGVLKENKIYVYFASDIESSHYNGYGNDYSEFNVTWDSQLAYQNILYFTIDVANHSFAVNDDVDYAIKATENYRRPGMPSIVKLHDGSYAMAMEHCGSISQLNNLYLMQIAISYSRDLVNWTTPKTFITPTPGYKAAAKSNRLAGAPTIQLLPSGRIAISYTTNEYYSGVEACDFPLGPTNYDQWFRTVELSTSTNVISYGSTPVMERLESVRTYGENVASTYGRCSVVDNKLILLTNNYLISDNTGIEASRTKITGLLLSVANISMIY